MKRYLCHLLWHEKIVLCTFHQGGERQLWPTLLETLEPGLCLVFESDRCSTLMRWGLKGLDCSALVLVRKLLFWFWWLFWPENCLKMVVLGCTCSKEGYPGTIYLLCGSIFGHLSLLGTCSRGFLQPFLLLILLNWELYKSPDHPIWRFLLSSKIYFRLSDPCG